MILTSCHGKSSIDSRVQRATCFANKPVSESHEFSSPVPAVRFIGMLDSMSQDATLLIEGEDKDTGELLFFGQFENRLFTTEKDTQAFVGAVCGSREMTIL